MKRDAARAELRRRRRWEREILRDALRGGHLREDPDDAWLPGLSILEEARALLKAGGCEAERRPLGLRADGLTALVDVRPGHHPLAKTTDAAHEQGAEALLLGSNHFAFGGSPRQLRPTRERFERAVVSHDLAADEADVAVAAALGADAIVARVRLVDDLPALLAAARCYALPVLIEADDRATLDAARSAEADRIILRLPGEDDERAADRSFRLLSGLPDPLEVVVAGVRSLKTALALRRAGADAGLIAPRLLDLEIQELMPADEPEPSFSPDPELLAALGAMGVADPSMFTQTGSGLLLIPGTEPTLPTEPEEPFGCPLDVLRARRPRGLRV